MRRVYFDHNATTPLDAAVRDAMLPYLTDIWGNPSSVHYEGRKARAALDDARDRAAVVMGCKPSEVIFTSGGTESANLAILGAARRLKSKGRHIITSAIEHHAVLHACRFLARYEGFEVTELAVTAEGLVSTDDFKRALRPDTILASIMAANNEIGTLQPVAELGALCAERGVAFHTDAVQWFGKEPFPGVGGFRAQLVSICAHKIYGPKGAGALVVKSPFHPEPLLVGGSHENEQRAGTENLASIVGLVEAMERFVPNPVYARSKLEPLTRSLISRLQNIPGVRIVGSLTQRLANTVAFVVEGSDSIALLAGLDLEGVCASSGSACSAGSLEPSHVVRALGLDAALAQSLVRFSLGRDSSLDEVDYVTELLPEVIARAQHAHKHADTL